MWGWGAVNLSQTEVGNNFPSKVLHPIYLNGKYVYEGVASIQYNSITLLTGDELTEKGSGYC